MAAASNGTTPAPRLNPFAFPSETDSRFMLLVASVLASSMFIYNWLSNALPGSIETLVSTYSRCSEVAPRDPSLALEGLFSAGVGQTPGQADFLAATRAYADCIAGYNQTLAGWMMTGVGLVLAVAALIYWCFPLWKIRRDGFRPLSAEDARQVVAYLEELSREAGLSRPPFFVWNPLSQAPTGVAFGRLGRRYVGITGGLVRLFRRDRELFRGVVLHELAHLRNADVDKAYFALSIAAAFVLVALLPFGVALLDETAETVLTMLWPVAALVALVSLSLASVLRAREVYADVRASTWDGPQGGLYRLLTALPRPAEATWRAPLRLHPHPEYRLAALVDPSPLFKMSLWEPFATGLAVAVAVPNVQSLFSLLTTRAQDSTLAPLLTGLVFAPLIVGVVGLGAWRMAFAQTALGQQLHGSERLAFGLAAGLVLGQAISLRTAIDELTAERSHEAGALVFGVLWGGLALLGVWLFLRWIMANAAIWLEVAAHARSPRGIYLGVLAVAAAALSVLLGVLFYALAFDWLVELAPDPLIAALLPFAVIIVAPLVGWWLLPAPLTILAVLSLWAVPFAAWPRRGRSAAATVPAWAALDDGAGAPAWRLLPSFQPGRALTAGLLGGVVFCGLLVVARLMLRVGLPETARDTDEFRVAFFYAQAAAAILIEAGVAAVVAARIRPMGALHALFAASVGGIIMAASLLGLNVTFGGTADWSFVQQTLWMILAMGALLVVPAALVAEGLVDWGQTKGREVAPAPSKGVAASG